MKVSGSGYAENRIAGTLFGEAIIVVLGTILLILSAKVQVPFYPVPMTLQTMVVIGLGLFLGPARGSGIVLAYILQGLAGLPVFAGTPPAPSGLAYVAGPTGGYLVGFVIAAFAAGWLARKRYTNGVAGAVALCVLATALVYVPGLAWLGTFTGYGERLLTAGLYPFVLGDLTKSAIVGMLFVVRWSSIPGLGNKAGKNSDTQ